MIPVRFNPANYSVKEGVDGYAITYLDVQGHHSHFDFTVTVSTQDGTAIGEPECHSFIAQYQTMLVWLDMVTLQDQ